MKDIYQLINEIHDLKEEILKLNHELKEKDIALYQCHNILENLKKRFSFEIMRGNDER